MSDSDLKTDGKTVVISVNPHSGATDRMVLVEKLADRLRGIGRTAIVLTDIPEVQRQADELLKSRQLRAVVAAGGDGTVSMLANLLPAGTPLAIFPLGTENLLAQFLGVSDDPERAAEMISTGRTFQMDAGRANGKLFVVMASCGFDAHVVSGLHSQRRGHITRFSYAGPIFSSIFGYRYPEIRVCIDGQQESWSSRWAFVFNVPRYAMNLQIIGDANASDGELDICTFRGGNLIRGLAYLAAVVTGQHRKWRDVRLARFETVRIESDQPVPYQLDGDPGGHLPLEITVLPRYLNLLVPRHWQADPLKP